MAQLISATEISWDIESPSRRRLTAARTAPSSLRSLVSCLVLMDCRVISFNGSGGLFAATRVNPQRLSPYSLRRRISQDFSQGLSPCLKKSSCSSIPKKVVSTIPRCSGSSGDKDETSSSVKTPFGYTRKDVILIGVGITAVGVGLKSGLEYVGVDPLQAGNVVQLVLVLGLTIGWISTYIFRVSNKEMTYAQQLRDYEDKVMQKRLESLTEAEMEALFEQVEEEKRRLEGEQVK